jgi:glutathione synthase
MERLFPPQQNAILLRGGNVEGMGPTISELGCFGTILVAGQDAETATATGAAATSTVIHNEYAGFLLRTKFSNVDEGGVASGFATLSSPYLFP